jgi:hypothetical protein
MVFINVVATGKFPLFFGKIPIAQHAATKDIYNENYGGGD